MRLEQSNFKATEHKIIVSDWYTVLEINTSGGSSARNGNRNQVYFDNASFDTDDCDSLTTCMKSLLCEAEPFLSNINGTIAIVESDRIQYHNEYKNDTQYRYSCRLHVEINFTSEADLILHSINNPFKP